MRQYNNFFLWKSFLRLTDFAVLLKVNKIHVIELWFAAQFDTNVAKQYNQENYKIRKVRNQQKIYFFYFWETLHVIELRFAAQIKRSTT